MTEYQLANLIDLILAMTRVGMSSEIDANSEKAKAAVANLYASLEGDAEQPTKLSGAG